MFRQARLRLRHELIEHLIAGAPPDYAINLIDIAKVGKLFGEAKRSVGDTRLDIAELLAGTPQVSSVGARSSVSR